MGDNIEKEVFKKEFPSNSHTQKAEEKVEAPKVQKIVNGKVKRQKRSLSKKFADTFLADDSKSVGQYILYDVLIPAAKSMLSEMIGGGLDMMLFGERRRGTGYGTNSTLRRDGSRTTITNYGGISRESRDTRDPRDRNRRELSRSDRARHNFDDVIIPVRGEAEDVLSRLFDIVVEYGMASVADFYEMVGIDAEFTDGKYGWTDLQGVKVIRVREGYLITLPRPQPID